MTIVEAAAMKQDVVANAAALAGGLASDGKVAVYGILFDTSKSGIKPSRGCSRVFGHRQRDEDVGVEQVDLTLRHREP